MILSFMWLVLAALFGKLEAGNYVDVKVEYNVFTVLESKGFEIKCTATHEDKRPQLRWYFINDDFIRRNITNFAAKSGNGNTAVDTYREPSARMSDTGDYFCEALVVKDETEIIERDVRSSPGVPVMVIKDDKLPRVYLVSRITRDGKVRFTCTVGPYGVGDLTLYNADGSILKHEKKVTKMEVLISSRGKHSCLGNLTLGGYSFVQSRAYASGSVGLTSQLVAIVTVLSCLLMLTQDHLW